MDPFSNSKDHQDEQNSEETSEKVSLQQLLLDCYEFHGLAELGVLVLFFFFASFYLFLQWGSSAAIFKNAVITSMVSYGSNQMDWQRYDYHGIDSMGDAVDFSTGYMQLLHYSTNLLRIPDVTTQNGTVEIYGDRVLYVTDFAQISYARFQTNLNRNCELKEGTIAFNAYKQDTVECWKTKCKDPGDPESCTDPDLTLFLKRWRIIKEGTNKGKFALTIFATQPWEVYDYTTNANVSLNSTAHMDNLMNDIDNGLSTGTLTSKDASDTSYPGAVDRRVIYKYGSSFTLGMVGSDRLSDRKDAAMFTLTTTIRGHNRRLLTTSGTSTIYLQTPGPLGTLFDILYVVFTLLFMRKEIARARLSMLQHRSMSEYLTKGWNIWQIVSHLCNMIWLVTGWCIQEVMEETIINDTQYQVLEGKADTYNIWLMCGIIVVFILGISLCRFMRIHVGLNAFYHVLTDSLREIADFLVFVAYLFVLLGSAIFAFFQIVGGNSMFIDYGEGVLAMARLMFGFLEFEEFHNSGMGLGTYYWTVTFLFWVSVVMLVLFTFNVLLAIFNLSFERVQKYSIKVEHNFVVLVLLRLVFAVHEAWYLYISLPIRVLLWDSNPGDEQLPSSTGTPSTPPRAGFWSRLKENFTAYRLHMYDHNTAIMAKSKKRNSLSFRLNLLFARWCISRMPEMQALLALYTDSADLRMIPADEKPSWRWLGSTPHADASAVITHPSDRPHATTAGACAESQVNSAGSSPTNMQRTLMQRRPVLRRGKRSFNYGLVYDESVPAVCEIVTRQQLQKLMKYVYQEKHSLGYQQDRWWMKLLVGSNPFDALTRSAIPHLLEAVMKVYSLNNVPKPMRDTDVSREQNPAQLFHDMTHQAEMKRLVMKRKVDDVMKMLQALQASQAVTSGAKS